MGKPSFPFYPDDWLNDLGLRACSTHSRAIWADILCLMHQGSPYGHLADAAGDLTLRHVASRCCVSTKDLLKAVSELESHKVFSRTPSGTIFSRRMVRDERLRTVRGQGGIKSLLSPEVPRPKGILKGILSGESKDTIDQEEVYSSSVLSINNASFEDLERAWEFYQREFPGDVNPLTDRQLLISVIDTREAVEALIKNLPLWKLTKKWASGYHNSSKVFLSDRMFLMTPKMPAASANGGLSGRELAKQKMLQGGL